MKKIDGFLRILWQYPNLPKREQKKIIKQKKTEAKKTEEDKETDEEESV